MARQGERRPTQRLQCRVRSRDQSLGGGFLIARCAVDLPGEIQPLDALGLQRRVKLRRRTVVVFHSVTRPEDLGIFKATNAPDKAVLHLERQACGNAVYVDLVGVTTLGLQKKLVRGLLCEFHDLVLDAGTVARPNALDYSREERRLVEVRPDDLMSKAVRMRNPAGNLPRTRKSRPSID